MAATNAPNTCPTRCIHTVLAAKVPSNIPPRATAGLNAPPDIAPTDNAPTNTINHIASPKKLLLLLDLVVAVCSTVHTSANVNNASAVITFQVISLAIAVAVPFPAKNTTTNAATIPPNI